jgi:TPR repeat protein
MRTFFALLLLNAIPSPASADFVAAEAAVRRGEYPAAYLACKSEADTRNAECQHLVGYLYQEGLGVPLNATEAIRLFRLSAKRGLAIAQCHLGFAYERGSVYRQMISKQYAGTKWRQHRAIRSANIF